MTSDAAPHIDLVDPLLPELIALQRRDRCLLPAPMAEHARRMNVPLNRVYSVASFYQAFRFTPCGRHQIKVCVGAACYVKGAEHVYEAFRKHLNIPDGGDTSPDGLFTVSKVACLGCCMLAVAVQIDKHIFGHVVPATVGSVVKDFLRMVREEEASGADASAETPNEKRQPEIRICRCSSCRAAGSGRIFDVFEQERRTGKFDYKVKEVGCHGMSYRAPLVTVALENAVYHYDNVQEYDVRGIVAQHFSTRELGWKGRAFLDAFYSRRSPGCMKMAELPPELDRLRLVTRNSGIDDPESLEDYRAHGGFAAFDRALAMTPAQIVAELTASKLRGRGGGGFPTGEKWRMALEAPGDRKIVICNADEGDPGAFMDRMLMESYPYRVLEGILIAARTIGAKLAIIYIREEYAQAVSVLERVIAKLRESGIFEHIAPGFDLVLFRGAGAFVCGEETALLESIEGRRGIPRKRPPFPVNGGLRGLPTLMNNVETFACVPIILADGGAAFNAVGTDESHGTKAFALAGKVRQGGLIEVPIGITIDEIVEKYGGGAEKNHAIKAVMIGGPSGGCIPKRHFDVRVDYRTLQKNGAMMGSGGLIVIDESDCMVDISLYFLRFLRNESCGKCVMCREGVAHLCDLVESLTRKGPKPPGLLDRIEELARQIQRGSLCALGRTAPNMVLSALHEFRSEFEAHLDNECPAGKCVELTEFRINDDCIGCTKCIQSCAAGAIECEPLESARILSELCVRCGVCRSVCPEHAVVNPCKDRPEQELPFPEEPRVAPVGGDVIVIDGAEHPFVAGRVMLDYVKQLPTLCYMECGGTGAHCMVCAVWDASLGRFVPGCEQLLQRGHVYETDSERVRAFRREALSLMLVRHDFRCGSCSAKGKCRFFDLVREYGAKKPKSAATYPEKVETAHLVYDAGKCILCQRCVGVSRESLAVHNRADRAVISPGPDGWESLDAETAANVCGVCPTGALTLKNRS
ncbi:MAG: NAD(P)H-dependent oxidoreductase subunit E [Lentisphaeria bacterium]|nr:NAD(P)H-dependent oxidoreductase subunit E [Lentisphaeria bacterium]